MTANWLMQLSFVLVFVFFQGLDSTRGIVSLSLPAERMAPIFGFSDQGSYLQAAQNLVANGRNTPEWEWVLNLWPPGMVWLDAIILSASPLQFGVSIGIVAALVWSLPLALLTWPFLRSARTALVVVAVEFAVFSTSPFQSWMLDEGLFYADGLASALFLLGITILVNRSVTPSPLPVWIRDGILAGIALAGTMLFRASYQLVPWILLGILVAVSAIVLVRRFRGLEHGQYVKQAGLVLAAGLSMFIALQPYFTYIVETRERTQLVVTEELVYNHVWEDGDRDEVPEWMQTAGSTLGCDIDPERCATIYAAEQAGEAYAPDELRDELIGAILDHPGDFVAHRVSYVWNQWFADESDTSNVNPPIGLLYLALLVTASASAIVLARRERNLVVLVIPLAALALLAPFSIVHVEVRYLIPLKLLGLLLPLLLLALQRSHVNVRVELNHDSDHNADTHRPVTIRERPS